MITAKSLTNGTLTIIIDASKVQTARNDHPKWKEIVEAFKAEDDRMLESLISLKAVVEVYSVGQLSINSTGVTYRGTPMHTVDSERVMAFLRDGLPYKPIANYMARKMANPSARAINELYGFLEHQSMPITPEGKIIAYKGVQDDWFSKTGSHKTVVITGKVNEGGQIFNGIGETIEVERSSVDDDFRQGCSFGLHAGSLQYATGFGTRVVLVEVDPADVVSVPSDSMCQKLRCCKYKVIGEYTGALPNTYTDEFSKPAEDVEPDHTEEEDETSSEISASPETQYNVKVGIYNQSREIIAEICCVAQGAIGSYTMPTDIGMDSLDGVEIMLALEEKFGIEIPENEWDQIAQFSFEHLVDYIYAKTLLKSQMQIPVDARTDSYNKGFADGSVASHPKFLPGDENGADSELHRQYIEGYLNGFKH